jgi:tetratricopeptide (TPR) repeat protein
VSVLIPILMVVSLALNAQGNQQFRAGNYQDAEQTYRCALTAAIQEWGEDHPATAMILGNLAGTEHALGRNSAAEEMALRALAALEKNVGARSILLVPSLNTLGCVYIDTGRYAQAETALKRAIRLGSQDGGAHYATSLHNLAALYQLKGQLDRAEKLYQRALRIRLRLFGPEDPLTLATARNIRALDQASARFARAAKSKPENSPR